MKNSNPDTNSKKKFMIKFKMNHFNVLESTNDKAKEFDPLNVIVALKQTGGKGRNKNKWSSETGGIYLSIVMNTEINNLRYITFVSALACQKTLNGLYNIDAKIKWPNDILIENKKISGILIENYFGKKQKTVIGIGINTNNTLPKELKKTATSLQNLGIDADNKKIISILLKNFIILYKILLDRGPDNILRLWRINNCILGKNVKIIHHDAGLDTIFGLAKDINDFGNLMIETKNKKIIEIIDGTILLE